jgi:phytoene dehydrogenase-like protein
VALDRQSIARRDFPAARRGYDQGAVDRHLAAIADEVEELRRRMTPGAALAGQTSEQVRAIIEAAEASAAGIREGATAEAREHVARVAEAADALRERIDALEREMTGMVGALRSGADLLRFTRFALLPVQRMGEELFAGEGARLLLAGNALHADIPPQATGSGLFGWLLAMLGQQVGFPVPEGGAGRLVDALVARLVAAGGELVCQAPVTQVLVDCGTAVGVRTAAGDRVRAGRAVLADVAAPRLFLDLVGAARLPGRLVADLRRFHWDHGTVKVDWALSAPVPWTAEPVRTAGTVHLGGDLDGLTGYAAALAAGRVPADPFLVLGQMTTADPSRSPAGTESLWAYTHLPAAPAGGAEPVRAVVDRMERLIERHAPGFGDLVVGRHVAGPADLERENPNSVHGTINVGTAGLHQQLVLRPVPGLGRADTPIDRLYLAGASAHPGGGVHGACGANAARAALARDRAGTGRVYAAGVRLAHRAVYGPS